MGRLEDPIGPSSGLDEGPWGEILRLPSPRNSALRSILSRRGSSLRCANHPAQALSRLESRPLALQEDMGSLGFNG